MCKIFFLLVPINNMRYAFLIFLVIINFAVFMGYHLVLTILVKTHCTTGEVVFCKYSNLGTLTIINFSIKSFLLFIVYSDLLNGDESLTRCFASR